MRFQIHRLQQSVLIELGLNTEDALLLDWLLNWKDGNSMKTKVINGDLAYWVNYGKVIEELPIMFKPTLENTTIEDAKKTERNNKAKVGRMLKGNLSKVLISNSVPTQKGTDIYVSLNRNLIQKLLNEGNKKATTVPPVEAKEVKNNNSNKSICNSTQDYTPVPNKNIQENNNNEPMNLVKEARINIKKADMNEVNEKCTNIDALKIAINNIKGKSHGINALMSAYDEALNGNSSKGHEWGKDLKGGLGSSDMIIGDKSIKDVPSNDLNKMVEMVNQPYLYK